MISTFGSNIGTNYTYNVVFDTVYCGIQKPQLRYTVVASRFSCDRAEVVLNSADLQHSYFHESPCGDLLRKFSIRCLAVLSVYAFDFAIEPLVLECFSGPKDRKSS